MHPHLEPEREGDAEADAAGLTGRVRAEVLGEARTVEVRDGVFTDEFAPWDVHLYLIRGG